jgi:hypothetical protein
MEKSPLRERASTSVNVTVGRGGRHYLTEREVERLIEAAKQNRCGHRDAKTADSVIGEHFAQHFHAKLPSQSSPASRLTAGAFGFSTSTQYGERPERHSEPICFDTNIVSSAQFWLGGREALLDLTLAELFHWPPWPLKSRLLRIHES